MKTRINIMSHYRVYRLRSKAFYEMAREENETIETFAFDCQKNMLLPKVADQVTYYSRQLNFYNFSIVQGTSRSKLEKTNVFSIFGQKIIVQEDRTKSRQRYITPYNILNSRIKLKQFVFDVMAVELKIKTAL